MIGLRSAQALRLLRGLQSSSLAADGTLSSSSRSELLPALIQLVEATSQCCQAVSSAGQAALPLPPAAAAWRQQGQGPAAGLAARQQLVQLRWSNSSSSNGGQQDTAASSCLTSPGDPPPPVKRRRGRPRKTDPTPVLVARNDNNSTWKMQTTEELLAVGGPQARDAAATIEYLQSKAGLTRKQAHHAVERIRNYASPQAQCFRLAEPRSFSFESEVKPVMDFLAGLPSCNLQRCLNRFPHILVESPVSRMRSNQAQLQDRLGLSAEEVGRVTTRFPFVLRMDLEGRVWPVLDYFAGTLGLSREKLRGMLLKYPPLVSYSLRKIKQRVEWLTELGLSEDNLRTVLWKYTQIVCGSRSNTERWRQWLIEQGISELHFAHVVTRLPMVLTYGQGKREEFLKFMREEMQVDNATISKVLHHVPDTMGRSIISLRRNVEVMQTHWGFTQEQIRRLVMGNPGVLRLDFSAVTYDGKLRFLRDHIQHSEYDFRELLIRHPFYISYRLDRIATRTCYLKAMGQPTTSLSAWLACSEATFCERFAKSTLLHFHSWLATWRQSEEGRYWLETAALRSTRMTHARLELEQATDEAARAATAAVLASEQQRSDAQQQRLEAAEQMLAGQSTS